MYHVDEWIELNQKKNENKERSYLHNHIQKKAVSIEIDHTALEFKSEKRGVVGEVFK